MKIYFLKNMKTGHYFGDELEPAFEKAFYIDYGDARNAAWVKNVLYKKDLASLDKYVVEVKEMNCPIMYVRYDNDCMRRFFDVEDAIRFYEETEEAYEIGWFSKSDMHSLDLTKDWTWAPEYVHCFHFDDSFWNSNSREYFKENPGKKFNAYSRGRRTEKRTLMISTIGQIEFDDDLRLKFRNVMAKALKDNAEFRDENGVKLTVKENHYFEHYDFGGSCTVTEFSLWYPNGRLFGYGTLKC